MTIRKSIRSESKYEKNSSNQEETGPPTKKRVLKKVQS